MPVVPSLRGVAGRCFARVNLFECECPGCGRLLVISNPGTLDDGRRLRRKDVYEPHTQTLRCPYCLATYQVGLLLFPVLNVTAQVPVDTRPTRLQRLELARLTGGFVMAEKVRADIEVNRVVEQPCSCPPLGWIVSCPVHGLEPS